MSAVVFTGKEKFEYYKEELKRFEACQEMSNERGIFTDELSRVDKLKKVVDLSEHMRSKVVKVQDYMTDIRHQSYYASWTDWLFMG